MIRPGIEFTKWAGVFCMLYDHLEYFSGVPLPLASWVGSLAFPLFAVAVGAALADAPGGKLEQVTRRMLAWGLLAQVAILFVRDFLPLNVLFTLASGLVLYAATETERVGRRAYLIGLALAVGTLSEFAFFGTALVACCLAHFRRGLSLVWCVVASLPLFAFNELALLSPVGVVVGWWLINEGPHLPRVRRAFYPVYVLQYPLLRMM